MRTRLERNERSFKCLTALSCGYSNGDFSGFFPFLSQDCVWESQWVMTALVGYEAVTDYLSKKGMTLRSSGSFPQCSIVELVGGSTKTENVQIPDSGMTTAGAGNLWYAPGKLCLHMLQTIEDKTNEVMVDLTLDDAGLITRVCLCMPELFHYRPFFTYVDLVPATDDSENDEGLVRVSEAYYSELHLFLGAVGVEFDEYADLHIPMDAWRNALLEWKAFREEKSFDNAYERLCGINYSDWSVTDHNALRILSVGGKSMWEEREMNAPMLDGLLEWTHKYAKEYTFVNSSGF